jgi:uncharacterized membrane protein
MKRVLEFLRATVMGGILFLMPLVVLVVVLNKALGFAKSVIRPLADRIPDTLGLGSAKVAVLAGLLIVAICFFAGLLSRTAIARRPVKKLEESILSYLPGYEFLKQEGTSVLGEGNARAQDVVLVRIGDSYRIGLRTEDIGDRWQAIFVPNSPNPHSGGVFIVEKSHVFLCDTPLANALQALRRSGAGAVWAADVLARKET